MSKHLTSLVALAILLSAQHARAQNTSPYWSLAGNSNATTSSKLGTTNAIPLRLFTNNATRVYIHPTSGNVGIGTSSPAQKLHVAGNTYITGKVGIGTNTLSYKLNVQTSGSTGGFYINNASGTYGIYINNTGPSYGIYANSSGGGTGIAGVSTYIGVSGRGNSYGVYGSGYYGVYGSGNFTGIYGTANTYAVYGSSTGGYGVYGSSTNSIGGYFSSSNSYGLWARTGRTDKNWAGVFEGNVYTYGAYQTSDKNLKTNIEDLGDALSVIEQLKPKSYEFRHDGKLAALNLPQGKHYGILAQELEEILPNLVMELENELRETAEKMTIKAVNYTELIPIAIKAIQEQQQLIGQQKQELDALKNELAEIKQAISMLSNGQGINTFLTSAQLGEVSPNPVKSNATIQYAIPEGSTRAQLLITDILGRQIKTIQLTASGVVNVDVTSLARGVYNYSLIVDNKSVATKKMTVVK